MSIAKRSIELKGHDGIRLEADAWGNPEGWPLILLHGGGQTRHAWGGTAEALAREGWYAVSVDQRGHGDSEWVADGNYTHLAFSDDVSAVCASFDRPPVLVGASLGGLASMVAVGERRANARALVLVDVAVRLEPGGVERIINFMKAEPDGFASLEDAADAIAAYTPHRPRPSDLSGLAKNLRFGDDGRYRWHWDPLFLEGGKRMEAVKDPSILHRAARALELPVLLVRGRLSDLLSEEGARQFLELVPHARFVDVSGAGHMVAGDRNDIFTEAVAGFLRTLGGDEAPQPAL